VVLALAGGATVAGAAPRPGSKAPPAGRTVVDGRQPALRSSPLEALSCASPCTGSTTLEDPTNPFYTALINCDTGAFTAATGPSHPAGAGVAVVYGGDTAWAGTSDLTIYVHNTDTAYLDPPGGQACVFDPPNTAAEPQSHGIEAEWTIAATADLTVAVREEIVAFGDAPANAGVRFTVCVTNPSPAETLQFGLRWQIDHRNAGDDGPLYADVHCPSGTVGPELSTETELDPAALGAFYRMRDNELTELVTYVNVAPLDGFPGTAVPDRLVYGYWFNLTSSDWNYLLAPGDDADSDSSVLYYFGHDRAAALTAAPAETVCRSWVLRTEFVCAGDCVDPPSPAVVGNTVRAVKDPPGGTVSLSWTSADPTAVAHRLRRGASKGPLHPPHPSAGDLPVPRFADPVLGDGRSWHYTAHGINCAGGEGP
jgi:hypothetical protein